MQCFLTLAMQCNSMQCNAMQCFLALPMFSRACNAMQCNAMQCDFHNLAYKKMYSRVVRQFFSSSVCNCSSEFFLSIST